MPPSLSHLGYTNSNFLYSMVLTQKKTTTGQVTTAATKILGNVFMPDTIDFITTEPSKVETNETNENDWDSIIKRSLVGLIPLGIVIMVYLLYALFKWCVKMILARYCRSNPGETTPLLQDKNTVGGQPPSYAELSPSYPSPPVYEDL